MAGTTRANGGRRSLGALVAVGILSVVGTAMPSHASDTIGQVERIRIEGTGSAAKVVISLSRPLAYDVQELGGDAKGKATRRLVLDFSDATLGPDATKPIAVASDVLRQVRTGQFTARTARVVVELASDAPHTVAASTSPAEVTIAFGGAAAADAGTPAAPPPAAPSPAAVAAEAPKAATETPGAAKPAPGLA